MGYWILVGMIVCALGMVLVALSASGPARSAPIRTGWQVRRSPGSDLGGTQSAPTNPVVRWTALVVSDSDHGWLHEVASSHPGCELTVLHLADATIDGIRTACVERLGANDPDVVSFQAGLDDLLAGSRIAPFAATLATVYDFLAARDASVVVGNIPNLARLSRTAPGSIDAAGLRRVAERWNREILAVSDRYGADVVDLSDVPVDAAEGRDGPIRVEHPDMAARFAPAIDGAMRRARELERADG